MSAGRWVYGVAMGGAIVTIIFLASRAPLEDARSHGEAEQVRPATTSETAIDQDDEERLPAAPFRSRTEMAKWTMGVLNDVFEDEERDAAWAEPRELEIEAVLAAQSVDGLRTLEAECRATICRVVAGFDPSKQRRGLHMLTTTSPLNTSGFRGIDPEDGSKFRLYISKEGTTLEDHPALARALLARHG